jgi:hypothetical protein
MTDQTAETVTEGGTNALAPAKPRAELAAVETGVLPILPRNIEEAQRMASGLIQAGVVPDAFKFSQRQASDAGDPSLKGTVNAPLVLMGILKSMELGVAPQTGLAGLLPLNGRFSVWGDLAAALAHRHGLVADQTVAYVGPSFDENTLQLAEWPNEYGCEVRYWRTGHKQPYVGRFTVRDAKRAGLWNNSNKEPWVKYPKRMLFNRARAFALRDGFADGLQGLSIAEEVMDHMEPTVDAETRSSDNMAALTADDATEDNGGDNGAA